MPKTVLSKTLALVFETDHYTSHPGGIATQPIPAPPVVSQTATTQNSITVSLNSVLNLLRRTPYLNGLAQTPIDKSSTTYTFSSLTANTPYAISFTDTNVSGEGPPSILLQATTDNPPVSTPSAPTITVLAHDTVTITVNSTGSVGATSYVPVRNGTVLPEFTVFPYVFRSLTPNTSYSLTVRAKNSAGTSADSTPVVQSTDAIVALNFPLKGAMYGGTNFTDAEEIARRAKFDFIVLQGWIGMSASMVQTHIDAVRLINPTIKIYLYMMLEGISDTDALGAFIETNKMWAYDKYPSGVRQSIWPGTHGVNLGGTRTVAGFTAGETLINMHAVTNGAVWATGLNGIMIDNQWYAPGYSYDVNEDGVTDAANSVFMRNAHITAYQKFVARIKHFHPEFEVGCNPRTPAQLVNGIDDQKAFQQQRWDFFMNQNAGPGMYFNGEGVFPYDGGITDFTKYRLWPSEAAISGTPAHGQLLMRATIGGFLPSTLRPQPNPTLGDALNNLQTGNWIANIQNILMETKGFTETEEVTYGAFAAQHNRVCLAYWYVLSDISPYLYGTDTAGTGRCVVHPFQDYFRGMPWVDAAPSISAPYATQGGLLAYYRRIGGAKPGCLVVCPRAERGAAKTAPLTITIPTPPLPPGCTAYTLMDGVTAVGATITIGHRDGLGLRAS